MRFKVHVILQRHVCPFRAKNFGPFIGKWLASIVAQIWPNRNGQTDRAADLKIKYDVDVTGSFT